MKKGYYKTKNEIMCLTLADQIDTLMYINAKSCEQSVKNLLRDKTSSLEDIKERNIKIGPLVHGEAYYHEKDQYYDVIGFLVESECEFHGNRIKTYGFRSIYFGKCNEYAPVDFDDGYSLEPTGQIPNGLGDHVEILDVLRNQDEVDKCIKENNIDINKYLKEVNLYLEPTTVTNNKKKSCDREAV